jgi:uncharacterized protein YjbJ (UPF0337 family)
MTTLLLDALLPSCSTGIGERRSGGAVPVHVRKGEAAMEDLTNGASEQVNQAADQAKDAASGAMDQAKDAAGEAVDKAKDILPGS